MKARGTDFVVYRVSDIARAAAFYRDVLGLRQEFLSVQHQWAEFDAGNVTLSLHGGSATAEPAGGGRIALAVDDVFAATDELKRRGVRLKDEPVDYKVCQAVEVLDPDGNTVILHHRADGTFGPTPTTGEKETSAIIAMERKALDRWAKGDPSGFLEISSPDVVYFDPTLDRRLDGVEALAVLYEGIRGQVQLDGYDLLDPKVQFCGGAAVLTFNFVGHAGDEAHRWNCTEVYQQTPYGWRIVQTHWSLTKPEP